MKTITGYPEPYTSGGNMLEPFPEKGRIKGSRIKDAASVLAVYNTMRRDDLWSAKLRTGVQAMLDGQPPWSDSVLRASGAGFRHNLNFGKGRAMLNQALAGYHDLIENVEFLIRCDLPVDAGDPIQRGNACEVIAGEFTNMLRDWNEFFFRWQILVSQYVAHGLSIGYFLDEWDWKFFPGGWDDIKMPRGTRATEEMVDVLMAEREYGPYELYAYIENEDAAKELGWDVELVKQALVAATTYRGKVPPTAWGEDWAKLQTRLKSNDLNTTYENHISVETVHTWVREYDGSYSHYISLMSPCGKKDGFLYKCESRFESASNVFTIFCYDIAAGVGHGTYHTSRGMGYDIFGYVQVDNRMKCDILDTVSLSNKMPIQPRDGMVDMGEPPITVNGPILTLNHQWLMVDRTIPDVAKNTLPIMHDFERNMEGVSPAYQQLNAVPDQRMTKYQMQARQGADATMSQAQQANFYRSWRRLVREKFRRVQAIIESDKLDEYPEVGEFVAACEARGVPKEIILKVNRVTEERAIGMGSPGARQNAFDRALQLIGTLDEKGRHALLRKTFISIVGPSMTDELMPQDPTPRPVEDQFDATIENAMMFGGGQIDPLDGQNHYIHAVVHLGGQQGQQPTIASAIQTLEDWRNNGEQGSIEALQPQISFLALILPHCEQHVQALSADKTREQQAAMLRKALQQYAAIWMTYMRQLKKAQDERHLSEQQDQIEAQQNGGTQQDPKLVMKAQESRQKMQIALDEFQQKQTLTAAQVAQQMELAKRKADVDIANKINKSTADSVQPSYLDRELPGASESDILTNARYHA